MENLLTRMTRWVMEKPLRLTKTNYCISKSTAENSSCFIAGHRGSRLDWAASASNIQQGVGKQPCHPVPPGEAKAMDQVTQQTGRLTR